MKEQKSFEITFRFTPPSLIGWIVIFLATITIVGIITISVIASEGKIEEQQDTEIHNVSNDEWVQIGKKGHCALFYKDVGTHRVYWSLCNFSHPYSSSVTISRK